MAKAVSRYESDGITPAEASYDQGAVHDGAARDPRRIWWRNASTAGESLEGCLVERAAVGANDGVQYIQIAQDLPLDPPGQPAASLASGIALEIGYYEYAVTFVTANGETTPGALRGITTTSGNQKVNLSSIPTGPAGTTARRIYRSAVGGGDLFLADEIADNETTGYLDETPDGSLGAPAPALNTSGSPGTWQTAAIAIGDLPAGEYAACWMRYSVPAGTPQIGNPRRALVRFRETGA